MKKVVITKYYCGICNKEYDDELKCGMHEVSHTLEDRLKYFEGSVICPDCEGVGTIRDTCIDISRVPSLHTCPTCKGNKVVIPQTKIVYNPISID